MPSEEQDERMASIYVELEPYIRLQPWSDSIVGHFFAYVL